VKTWLMAIVCCGVMGCKPEVDTPMNVEVPPKTTAENRRIQVTRIGVIEDTLAYGSLRGIYIIKDTVTGKEYVGISGVGISELGEHKSGKSTFADER